MNTLDDGKLLEFVCPACLRSVRRRDTDRVPRCLVCSIRMLPDTDEPIWRPQSGRKKPAPRTPQPAPAVAKGKPRSSAGKKLAAV